MTVSDRIKECREAHGLSKAQLAKKAGFSRATITHIEQRRTDGLSAITLKKLADVLGVSTDYLLGRVGHRKFERFKRK